MIASENHVEGQPVDHLIAARLRWLSEQQDEKARDYWDARGFQKTHLPELRQQFAAASQIYGPFPPPPAEPKSAAGEIHFTGDKVARLADADDITPVRPRPLPEKFKEELVSWKRAEREYLAHAKVETGSEVEASPEEVARQVADRQRVREQSHELASILESAGKNAYRNEMFALWKYYIHSGHVEKIPNFRRICLLPYVAAIVRAEKLAALEFFLQKNPFCRFWTFTSGERVGIDELRKRIKYLHGRLNRLNTWLRDKWGVEIVFRSTELGTVEFDDHGNRVGDEGTIEYDAAGNPLFHVHAHCVVRSTVGFIKPERWSKMCEEIWEFWGHNLDVGKKGVSGVIRNAREVCKYVTKPGDMLKLGRRNAAALGKLHEAVFRMKLCQPMGSLAEEIRSRKTGAYPKTLRRVRTSDGCVWKEVLNHNAWLKTSEEEREEMWNLLDAHKMAEETRAAARAEPGETPKLRERSNDWCQVFSRLGPSVGPLGLKEPRVIVGGTIFDLQRVKQHPLVSRLWAHTVQDWEEGLSAKRVVAAAESAAPISVHTGTPTSSYSHEFGFMPNVQERMRPPPEPVLSNNFA